MESQHLPPCLHLTVSPVHDAVADEFLGDLEAACHEASTIGEGDRSEEAVIYGLMGTFPDRGQALDMAVEYLNDLYRLKP